MALTLSSTSAATLEVGEGKQFTTIASALLAAQPGDTIKVTNGTYKEDTLVVRKSIHLLGENWPVLDGQNKFEILKVAAANVTVSGFKFINSGAGSIKDIAALRVENARSVSVFSNIFEGNYFAIYLAATRQSVVRDNKIIGTFKKESSSGNGIHLWKCDSITVEHNTVTGHRDGLYFEFVTNSDISYNISYKNVRYGLHFMFSDGNSYEHNHFTENGSGVAIMYTKNMTMRYNVFANNWGGAAYGLLLKNISRSEITHNRFNYNTVGIYAEESDKLHINNNLFSNNGWAIKILSSSVEDTLMNNNFYVNSFDVSTSGSTNGNFFSNNYWDKYSGYDLDKNGLGDIPYRPVSLFSMILDRIPYAVMLLRSIVADILDQVERVYPQAIPAALTDESPRMTPLQLDLPEKLSEQEKSSMAEGNKKTSIHYKRDAEI